MSAEELETRLRSSLEKLPGGLADKLIALARSMAVAREAPTLGDEAPAELPDRESTIRAAISHTFTIASPEAAPNASPFDEIRPEGTTEQRALLAHSTTVLINGRQRLLLKDASRANLLDRVHDTDRYRSILRDAASTDIRDFSAISTDDERLPAAWLRSFLTGDHGDLARAPARELRAAVEALERLQLVTFTTPPRPDLPGARRMRGLAELLEPLRLLIGQRGGWEGAPATDRFAGREDELTKLRGFVDELQSQSVGESVQRFFSRSYRLAQYVFGVRDESVFFIEARGGLGKSTLIAKFMLDHALSQSRPFPFAYLDFDRGALRPRHPRSLLAEVARQVQLQMQTPVAALDAFCERLRIDVAGGPSTPEWDPFDAFREVMQRFVTMRSRPLLIVLDTMEVVQYDPQSLASIITFLTNLSGALSDQDFPELKIVAAGRADIPDLRTNPEERPEDRRIVLEALPLDKARYMASRLGEWLMAREWQADWALRVAGRKDDPAERREPLTLRVAVELLRDTPREERAALARDIEREGEEADQYFVGRLYERRILSHIRNDEVRSLAWPGLIFRRMTPDLIRDPLAALCSREHPERVEGLKARAQELFNALANEVWMVEDYGANTIRHRPDLRSRTLPLMRRHDREKFDEVNEAAIEYYASRRSDAIARAEWVYHRLLSGEDCEVVDQDWTPELSTLLVGASDDFDSRSEQRSYLLSRTATGLLPPAQLARLPTRLALDHIARTGQQFGSFDDVRVEPVVLDLAARIADERASTTFAHPARAVLLVKTGQWQIDAPFGEASGEWAAHASFAARFKRARVNAISRLAAPTHLDAAVSSFNEASRPMPSHTVIQDLAYARIVSDPAMLRADKLFADLLVSMEHMRLTPSDFAALHTAVVFGLESSRPAAKLWRNARQYATARSSVPSLSLAELRALFGAGKHVRSILRRELEIVLQKLAVTWPDFLRILRDPVAQPMRITHPDIDKVIGAVLEALLADESSDALRHLRAFFAARDPDWLVPIAYAVARSKGTPARAQLLKSRMESHIEPFDRRGILRARRKRLWSPKEALGMLRVADEAADLLGVARICEEESTGRTASDLSQLLAHYTGWRACIQHILDEEDAPDLSGHSLPKPLPVRHKDDIQKDRWGGVEEREGRRLEARLGEVTQHDFDVDFIVRSTDGSPLEGPVIFHLHDTFPRSRIVIRTIRERSWASLHEVGSYGVFTAGAQVRNRYGSWTSLEIDLKSLEGLPKRFLSR